MNSINLGINCSAVCITMEDYIRQLVTDSDSQCVMIGLSGGIDSAVLATFAVRAVGPERVRVYHLYDRDSEPESAKKAQVLADWLKIPLHIADISNAMRRHGIYSPFIMRISTVSHFLNRMIQHSYYALFRETPHKSSLRAGCGEFGNNPFKRLVYSLTIRHIEAGFNARHVHRREFIEDAAHSKGCLVLGAANRSESMVGWFVKDGIDDMPVQPMLGLYKTQVWQLADHLALPPLVRNQLPSPDMMKGITDEFAIGIEYRRLDLILDCLDRKLDSDAILALGISQKELRHVREIHRLSAWKRESEHIKPPVDGIAGSRYRI